MANLAVLLRDGTHSGTGVASIFYALKCSDFAVQVTKTPIQIPIPQQSPELIDIGVFRPSLTISGVVDNAAVNTSTTSNYEGMEAVSHTRAGATVTYYIPYKNKLEEAVYKWVADESTNLELEVGDASFPVFASSTQATGGGIYEVAIQQCRFQLNAAKEDRWDFTMQFVCRARSGVVFPSNI